MARESIYLVGIFCDGCGRQEPGDVVATSQREAEDGLRVRLVAEKGWRCDAAGDLCPRCRPAAAEAATGEGAATAGEVGSLGPERRVEIRRPGEGDWAPATGWRRSGLSNVQHEAGQWGAEVDLRVVRRDDDGTVVPECWRAARGIPDRPWDYLPGGGLVVYPADGDTVPAPLPVGPPEVEALRAIDRIIGNEDTISAEELGKVRGIVLDTLNAWHERERRAAEQDADQRAAAEARARFGRPDEGLWA